MHRHYIEAGDKIKILAIKEEMKAEEMVSEVEKVILDASSEMLEIGEGVGVSAMTSGELSNYDVYAVERAVQRLESRNVSIYDSSELSAIDFRTKCRRFKARHPELSLIVVDYLQLMSSGRKNNDNRQYEVAEILRVMKSVAVELECPVIALSQLSWDTEKRTSKKPQLSDLRDSGAIEQDADAVMILYREDYYSKNENNDKTKSIADIRIAKNRTARREYAILRFSETSRGL